MWKTTGNSFFSLLARKAPSTAGIADDRLRIAADRFYEFQAKLRYLETILRRHLKDLCRSMASRALVVQALGNMSADSPLFELVGQQKEKQTNEQTPVETTVKEEEEEDGNICSYASLQAKVGHEASAHLERYETEIARYVTEWEKTVSRRVATELKHIQNLYRTMEKYHEKLSSLTEHKKKKKTKPSDLEKIGLIESKLRTARKEYRRNLIAVTLLTEEVTDRGWKDLIPLMTRIIDLEIHSTSNVIVTKVAENLLRVRNEMVELGHRYEMDFEAIRTGRLRILLEEDAIDFCDPEDFKSVEESTVVGHALAPPTSLLTTTATTPPTSNESSSSHDTGEDQKDGGGLIQQEHPSYMMEETQGEDDDDEEEDRIGGPYYPRSIYMTKGKASNFIDDETTLTGEPDMVSV